MDTKVIIFLDNMKIRIRFAFTMTSIEELEERFRKEKSIPEAVVIVMTTYLYGVKAEGTQKKADYMTAAKAMATRLLEEMTFPADPKPTSGPLGKKFSAYKTMIEEAVYLTSNVNGK
ncbi:MAG: hypothetical protein ACK5DE_10105 [Bacteroidota bacterium]